MTITKERGTTIMFNPAEFINDLEVNDDDEDKKRIEDSIELNHLIYNNQWTVRQVCYSIAWGMLSHLNHLGNNLLPKAEQRINQLEGNGILSESDITVGWGKKYANEDKPHINDEISVNQQVDNQKTHVDEIKERMKTVAISFVLNRDEHDELSMQLNQLSFKGIQNRSAQKRTATG